MAVKVFLTGKVAEVLGEEILLPPSKTVEEMVVEIAQRHEEAKEHLLDEGGKVREGIIILLNEESIEDLSQPLKEGDEVFILLPIAGG